MIGFLDMGGYFFEDFEKK